MNGEIDIEGLDAKWSTASENEPLCASCSVRISGEDENEVPLVPIRLWKKEQGKDLELALCPACYHRRIGA